MENVKFTNDELQKAGREMAEVEIPNEMTCVAMPELEEIIRRPLKAADIYPMARIISKIGINEFAQCMNNDVVLKMVDQLTIDAEKKEDFNEDSDTEKEETAIDKGIAAVGISVMLEIGNVILSHLDQCEKDINKLLGSLYGLPYEDIEVLDPAAYLSMIIDVIQDDKFADFIKVASKLFNKGK